MQQQQQQRIYHNSFASIHLHLNTYNTLNAKNDRVRIYELMTHSHLEFLHMYDRCTTIIIIIIIIIIIYNIYLGPQTGTNNIEKLLKL